MNRWKTTLVVALVLAPFAFAGSKADDVKETDRLQNANHRLYGNDASAAKIITEPKIDTPAAGKVLVSRLQQASPHLKP